jgi:protein FRG1
VAIKTSSAKYISVPRADADVVAARKAELRADAEAAGEREGLRIKCQREFVLKARVAALEGEGVGGKRRLLDRGPKMGSYEDEMRRRYVERRGVLGLFFVFCFVC